MGLIYLASPVDRDKSNGPGAKLQEIRRELVGRGHTVFCPRTAWSGNPMGYEGDIDAVNREVIRRCDALVAYLPEDTPSIGVPTEIEFITRLGRRTLALYDGYSLILEANELVHRMQVPYTAGDWARFAAEVNNAVTTPGNEPVLDDLGGGVTSLRQLPYTADEGNPDFQPELVQAYPGDAGLDLTTTEDIAIPPGVSVNIPCGVAVQLPPDTFGWVVARSSTFSRWGLMVLPGIIDSGYRGQLMILAYRPPSHPEQEVVFVPAGTKLGQLVVLPALAGGLVPTRVERLDPSERGALGFGSSGM